MNVADSSASFQISWSSQSHQGRVRQNNEDAFLGLMFDRQEMAFLGNEGEAKMDQHEFIFAVSDGMGGEKAGEFASKIVIETVIELVSREFHQKTQERRESPEKLLHNFCQRIHERARHVSQFYEECKGMGATLSLCWMQGNQAHVIHVGDSRIYHLPKNGEMRQLTEDHTIPGRLLRAGKISEREARNHPYRSQLEKSIGCEGSVEPQITAQTFDVGDFFVLCSDGITDGVWNRGIEKFVCHPPPYLAELPAAQRLVKEALDAGGRDNLTALVLQVCQ